MGILLIFISILAFLNVAVATGRSEIAGHTRSGQEVTEKSLATSTLLDLGADTSTRPFGTLHGLTERSQTTGTRQLPSKPTDQLIFPNPSIDRCSLTEVVVTQDKGSYLPDGTPLYHVTIINNCLACSMENLHIACGDWASTTEVNPAIFRKLSYNNCIVNNGWPLTPLNMLYFEYANSHSYPMHVTIGGASSCS